MSPHRLLTLGIIALLVSCGSVEQEVSKTYDSAEDQLLDEYTGKDAKVESVTRVLELSKKLTLDWRSAGIRSAIAAVKSQLQTRGKTSVGVDDVEDFTLGQPLPGVDWEQPAAAANVKLPAGNPNADHWTCPPIDLKGDTSCVQIVDAAKKAALNQVDPDAIYAEAEKILEADAAVNGDSDEFKDYAKSFLFDLALAIHKFGIEIGAARAEYTMREEGVCDAQKIDGEEIARLRGIKESTLVLRKLVGLPDFGLQPQGADCLKIGKYGADADAKIAAAIKAHVDKTRQEGLMCPDTSYVNAAVQQVFDAFEEGLKRGIEAQLATVWVGTFRNGKPWKIEGKYVVAKIDLTRMTGAEAVVAKIRKPGEGGGIPWFAFVDESGEILITSTKPGGGNIGFPVDPEKEIPHFVAMLKQTRAKISDADIEYLRAALIKADPRPRGQG